MSSGCDGHGGALPSLGLLSLSLEGATSLSLSWFCRRNDMKHAKGPTQALRVLRVTPVYIEDEFSA